VEPSASEVVIPHVVSLTMDSTEDDELIKDVLALVSPPRLIGAARIGKTSDWANSEAVVHSTAKCAR
jgi:hypothetical protein